MGHHHRSADRRQWGFTLTELIVVIFVLGLLAGMVVYAIGDTNDTASRAACQQDAGIIKAAEAAHFQRTHAYASEAALVAEGSLTQASTLHDVVVTGNSYTITANAECQRVATMTTASTIPTTTTTAATTTTAPATTTTTPGGLPFPNPVSWFDASDAATVVRSGGTVTSWTDKGTSHSDLNNDSGSSTITYSASGLNGHPTVSTTGVALLHNNHDYGTTASVFVVARWNPTAFGGRILSGWNNDWVLGWWQGVEDTAQFVGWVYADFMVQGDGTLPALYTGQMTNTHASAYRDGALLGSADGTFAAPNGLVVGGAYNKTDELDSANVAEVLVYDTVLSSTDRHSVEQYLATKWGLTLAG